MTHLEKVQPDIVRQRPLQRRIDRRHIFLLKSFLKCRMQNAACENIQLSLILHLAF